jgi:hypothetical protein
MSKFKKSYTTSPKDNKWIGVIVDSNDPLKIGRVKIRVFGMFDERKSSSDGVYPDENLKLEEYLIESNFVLPNESLPWVHQKSSTIFAGGESKGYGSFSYPKTGSLVRVEFVNDDIYSGEYDVIALPNKTMITKIENDYEGSQVLIYDEDEDLSIIYTRNLGFQFFHKGSQIVIRPDSSIFIEHKDTSSLIELKGADIKIVSNRDIDITSDNKITVNSNIVHINGDNTYIGESPLYSAVNGEPLIKTMEGLATLIDAKLSPTPGVATALVQAGAVTILSKTVKTSP